ncbi:hypothetical protein KEH90_004506 [Salmonella enterica]|nr:hypothetical protein [Salmonella enterica]
MALKFTWHVSGGFSGGLLPVLPYRRQKRPERVSAVRVTDVMVNPVALTCLPLCTVVSENNYIVRRTALFGRRKAVLQTMVYRYEFFWH